MIQTFCTDSFLYIYTTLYTLSPKGNNKTIPGRGGEGNSGQSISRGSLGSGSALASRTVVWGEERVAEPGKIPLMRPFRP